MKRGREVLLKSFGNGVAMLRFQSDQTPDTVAPFVVDLGMPTSEFVIGNQPTEVFLMLEEGHPATEVEFRNTEDEWDSLVAAVRERGSKEFWRRVDFLGDARKLLSGANASA